VKGTKSEAGRRTVALFSELRRLLRTWQIKSPYTAPENYIVSALGGVPVMERNLRRALDAAKTASGIDGGEEAPELACAAPLGWEHLADGARPTDHDRERDDGPQQSRLHARLLRP
jgi:hypothetical protein